MKLRTIRATSMIIGVSIIFLTLGPVGIRSMSPVAAQYDRALAFAVIGALAIFLAPRKPWLAVLMVLSMVVSLEAAQRFTLDRHGHLIDGVEKLGGACVGICLAYAVRALYGILPRITS